MASRARARAAPRVALVAPARSYRLPAYIRAGQRLGIGLIVVSDSEHAMIPEADVGVAIKLDGREDPLRALLAGIGRADVAAVIATDDDTVELASRAAARLGCRHNPPGTARLSRRKDLARARLRDAGLPVPDFRVLELRRPLAPQCATIEYPCVLKPVGLSGSQGVIRCDDLPALLAAVERCRRIVSRHARRDERDVLLVESFLPGREIAFEGVLTDGAVQTLAVFDKPDALDGPYFEETYYIMPSRLGAGLLHRVTRRVEEASRAYGLWQGPIHAELRVHSGDATVLEIAARTIGGECARLLRFGSGRTLEELVLRHALYGALGPEELTPAAPAAGVLMIPTETAGTLRRVEGVVAALQVPLIKDLIVSVREGYELVPLPEGSSYLGFIFAEGESPQAVETALRTARSKLEVVTAPAWRIEPPGAG